METVGEERLSLKPKSIMITVVVDDSVWGWWMLYWSLYLVVIHLSTRHPRILFSNHLFQIIIPPPSFPFLPFPPSFNQVSPILLSIYIRPLTKKHIINSPHQRLLPSYLPFPISNLRFTFYIHLIHQRRRR